MPGKLLDKKIAEDFDPLRSRPPRWSDPVDAT
jgi:hypothetical protein